MIISRQGIYRLGSNIREARIACGVDVTQDMISKLTGISKVRLGAIEAGYIMATKNEIASLCDAMKVTRNDLLNGVAKKHIPLREEA